MSQGFSIQANGPAHSIDSPVRKGGNFQAISFFAPPEGAVDGGRVELYDELGNTLCHISLRPKQDLIAINGKLKGSNCDYSKEVRTSFKKHLPPYKVAQVGATDYSDHYLIEFSDGDAVKFPKLLELAGNKGSSIAYLTPIDGPPVLSNPVNIHTHSG